MNITTQVVEAVNYLVASKSFASLVRELHSIVAQWKHRPMVYAGERAILNALIDVGVTNPEAFDRLLDLAASKRANLPITKRVEYQRNLMQERRQRLALVVELHERTVGSRLSPAERRKFVTAQQERWRREREAYLSGKGALDWKARNACIEAFWKKIDETLQLEVEAARRVQHRKRVVHVERPPANTQMRDQLQPLKQRRR